MGGPVHGNERGSVAWAAPENEPPQHRRCAHEAFLHNEGWKHSNKLQNEPSFAAAVVHLHSLKGPVCKKRIATL